MLSVTDGSAADNAGILVGDIITQVDGYDVQSRDDLAQELTFHSAGETCEVVVYRSGEYQTLTVTFDSVPRRIRVPARPIISSRPPEARHP